MRSNDIRLLNNGFNMLVKLFDVFKYSRVASDKAVQRKADTCSESIGCLCEVWVLFKARNFNIFDGPLVEECPLISLEHLL